MARQLSIVVVYPAGTQLSDIRRVMEDVFNAELTISDNLLVGDACACIVDVKAPDGFVFHAAKRGPREGPPGARTKMMDRFPEPRWARPRWSVTIGVAVGIGVGIAMVFISDPLRPLAGRMRGAPG